MTVKPPWTPPMGHRIRKAIMISMSATGEWKTTTGEDFFSHDDYDQAHAELDRLLRIAKAARILHAGLTCAQDPMDVDERIAALGALLVGPPEGDPAP